MAVIKRFEDLEAWRAAREVVPQVYKQCGEGRLSKDFALRDQLCRAAVSCMSNIAEGFSRNSDKDFAHFLDIVKGSALEVQSLLYVALDLNYIEKNEFTKLYEATDRVAALTGGLISYLRKQP
jgi:four helix bundle protein